MSATIDTSPGARARAAGALFLLTIVGGIVGQSMISDRLVAPSDAAATAKNILAHTTLYRTGFSIFMIEMAAQIGAALLFYDLLKPVNRSIARAALTFELTGCGIKTLARLFYYAPLLILGGGTSLAALGPGQPEALALLSLKVNSQGAAMALMFFGFSTTMNGWLIMRSGFLPRALGVLSMVSGIGWLTFVWPPLGYGAFLIVALVALAGSVAMIGWLLVKGVDEPRWRERAIASAGSIWR